MFLYEGVTEARAYLAGTDGGTSPESAWEPADPAPSTIGSRSLRTGSNEMSTGV